MALDMTKLERLGLRDVAHGKTLDADVKSYPLSSWSSDKGTAEMFATGSGEHILLTAKVPRERIFSTARTGLGALPEQEFVVLDGPGKVHVENIS